MVWMEEKGVGFSPICSNALSSNSRDGVKTHKLVVVMVMVTKKETKTKEKKKEKR